MTRRFGKTWCILKRVKDNNITFKDIVYLSIILTDRTEEGVLIQYMNW